MKSGRFRTSGRTQGLTLIELVLTLAVLGILATFIARPLIDLIQYRAELEQQTDRQTDIEYALARITEQIRFRGSVIDCKSGSISFGRSPELVYKRNTVTNHLIVDPAPPESTVLVNNVTRFDCKTIPPASRLHQLVLSSDGSVYTVRAFQRK